MAFEVCYWVPKARARTDREKNLTFKSLYAPHIVAQSAGLVPRRKSHHGTKRSTYAILFAISLGSTAMRPRCSLQAFPCTRSFSFHPRICTHLARSSPKSTAPTSDLLTSLCPHSPRTKRPTPFEIDYFFLPGHGCGKILLSIGKPGLGA